MNNQIEKHGGNAPEKRNDIVGAIQKAIQSPYLLKMPEHKRDAFIIMCLRQASILTGKTLTEQKLNVYCDELLKDINRSYQWLRADELKIAIENGSKGIYGTVYDLTYTAVYNWLREYRDSDERKQVIEECVRAVEAVEAMQKKPEQQAADHLQEMAQIAWDIYSVKRNFLLIPEDAFFYMERTKKIDMTIEQKNEMLAKVQKWVNNRKNDPDFVNLLPGDAGGIKTLARRWAVGQYFETLIENQQKFQP